MTKSNINFRTCGEKLEWDSPNYCNFADCPDLQCPDTYFNVVIGAQATTPKKTQQNKAIIKKLLKKWGKNYGGPDNKKASLFTFTNSIEQIFDARNNLTPQIGKYVKNIRPGSGGNFTTAVNYAVTKSLNSEKMEGYPNIALLLLDSTDFELEDVKKLKRNFERVIVLSHQEKTAYLSLSSAPSLENLYFFAELNEKSVEKIGYQVSFRKFSKI